MGGHPLMKEYLCSLKVKSKGPSQSLGSLCTSLGMVGRSSGQLPAHPHVISLQLEGQKLCDFKLKPHHGTQKGVADIYELKFRLCENTKSEILIISPQSITLGEYGTSLRRSCRTPRISTFAGRIKNRILKLMGGTNGF